MNLFAKNSKKWLQEILEDFPGKLILLEDFNNGWILTGLL